jgi:hypothetical protein
MKTKKRLTRITTEFGDKIAYDGEGFIMIFLQAPMDETTFEQTRSIPLPATMSELEEYLTRRRELQSQNP